MLLAENMNVTKLYAAIKSRDLKINQASYVSQGKISYKIHKWLKTTANRSANVL